MNGGFYLEQETLDQIHEAYVLATQSGAKNPVAIMETLAAKLSSMEIISKDIPAMDLFIDKLSKSIPARKQTFRATNMCTEILHTAMYVVIWTIDELGLDIDTNITARRKSLESELTKELELSDHLIPSQIMDRFGIRFIILNDEDAIRISCIMASKILNVLCSLNRADRTAFFKYIEKKFDSDTQCRIKKLLEIPFVTTPVKRSDSLDDEAFNPKEYPDIDLPTEEDCLPIAHLYDHMKFYYKPKRNGYQSMHVVLCIDTISPKMPGFQIELQFRTMKMHVFAENDINASHDAHKRGVADYAKIFSLNEEELKLASLSTRAFNSYKNSENDLDGIHFPKVFYNRRMNRESFGDDFR